jgi:RNA polymerase sigma-32 factor
MERRLGQGELSLDAPVSRDDDGGASHLDMLESAGDTRPDVQAEGDEFRTLLRDKLAAFEKTLRGREQTIFRERLLNDSPKTLQEIGEGYGISRERARQLEKRLTAKLKTYLAAELGDAVQIAMGLED